MAERGFQPRLVTSEPRLIPMAISALHLTLQLKMQKGKMLEGILVGPGSAEFHVTDPLAYGGHFKPSALWPPYLWIKAEISLPLQ